MSDHHRAPTHPTARKQHRCEACYGPIPVGETHVQQTGYWEGSAYRNRYHQECWDALIAEYDFEYCPGELPYPERIAALVPPTPPHAA